MLSTVPGVERRPSPGIPQGKMQSRSGQINQPLSTPSRVDTNAPERAANSPAGGVEAILVRRVSGQEVKAFRGEFNVSARGLAQLLNYSKSYIKRIEGKSLRASVKFSNAFFVLREEWAKTPAPQPHPLTVIAPGALPEDVTTLLLTVRPRRCANKKCHTAFVPRNRQQKFCSEECRERAARRKRKVK